MKFYLYFVYCLLITSCVYIKKPSSLPSLPTELPKNNLFSLKSDNNLSEHKISFKSLNLDEGLYDFIDLTLHKNPGWITKLSKLEEVKSGLNFLTNGAKANLNSSVGWTSGKENTRDSDFKTSKIPQFQSNVGFAWELDMWGKWEAHRNETHEILKAEHFMLKSAKLALIYEASKLWYMYKFLSEDRQLVYDQIQNHHEYHILHLHKYNAGLDDNESIIKMENQIRQLVLEHNRVDKELSICAVKIGSLIGKPLDHNLSNVGFISEEQIYPLPAVLPTKYIEQRPDVMEIKARLTAHDFHTFASKLDLYPSLQLRLSGIGMSGDLSNPFKQWKIAGGPSFNIPILDPQRKTQLKFDLKKMDTLKNQWVETIIRSVMEIESAAISHNATMDDLKIVKILDSENKKLLAISSDRFKHGLISKIEYLQKENEFLDVRRRTILAERNNIFSFLDLTKSLGINWN